MPRNNVKNSPIGATALSLPPPHRQRQRHTHRGCRVKFKPPADDIRICRYFPHDHHHATGMCGLCGVIFHFSAYQPTVLIFLILPPRDPVAPRLHTQFLKDFEEEGGVIKITPDSSSIPWSSLLIWDLPETHQAENVEQPIGGSKKMGARSSSRSPLTPTHHSIPNIVLFGCDRMSPTHKTSVTQLLNPVSVHE